MNDAESGAYISFLEHEFARSDTDTLGAEPSVDPGDSGVHPRDLDTTDRDAWAAARSAVDPRSRLGPLFGVTKRDINKATARLAIDPSLLPRQRIAQRCFDIFSALCGLVMLAPLIVCIAIAIRLDSPGPVISWHRRIGAGGQTFSMIKFRTVSRDSDQILASISDGHNRDGVLFKRMEDPLVTRMGWFLRRTSLDELLQLWNVVRGEMALVGPRPALPGEVAHYDSVTRRRLLVKPGLTGLWQVSGRSEMSWEEAVQLDLEYVDNAGLRLDLAILWRTVKVTFTGRVGGY